MPNRLLCLEILLFAAGAFEINSNGTLVRFRLLLYRSLRAAPNLDFVWIFCKRLAPSAVCALAVKILLLIYGIPFSVFTDSAPCSVAGLSRFVMAFLLRGVGALKSPRLASRDNSRHAFFEFQIPCIFSADRKHALALSCNRIVNALVGVFHDAGSNFRFHGVPFYGFDFDLSVEMLAVAVALMALTLSLCSASGFWCFALAELRFARISRRSLQQLRLNTHAFRHCMRIACRYAVQFEMKSLGCSTVALNAGIILIKLESIH